MSDAAAAQAGAGEAAPPAAPTAGKPAERADLLAWLAVGAGSLGTFMALLDMSIVNASLPIIQGEIGATRSEGTWVSTSYLVAEIIVIPLTGWLVRLLSMRRLMLWMAGLFTIFSVICGLSPDIETMVVGRIGQGLAGGTMIPTAYTLIMLRLPPQQRTTGFALFSAAALVGPAIGPVLGGWITENISWHYAFFVNVPICIAMMLALFVSVPKSPAELHELFNADWFGIAGMLIGLGSLTVLLEEGHREQWFQSTLISWLAVASIAGFLFVAIGQFGKNRPVIKLSLARTPSMATCCLMTGMTGVVMTGTLFLSPQFLAAVAGYNAFQAGKVAFLTSVTSLTVALSSSMLLARVDVRIIVMVGLLAQSLAAWLVSGLTADSVGSAFLLTQILLGLGVSLVVIPLQQLAVQSVDMDDVTDASSLMVVTRNLGSAVGLAAIASFQDQRIDLHHWQLQAALSANDPGIGRYLGEVAAMFGGGDQGLEAAYRILDGQIMVQALVMSFNDVFLALSIFTLVVIPLAIFLPKMIQTEGTAAAHG